jgi:hypothetical protein
MKTLAAEEETKTGQSVNKRRSRSFGTVQATKERKREESRRIMNSYSTHNDVTALEFCCFTRKNKKTRSGATGVQELTD